MVKIALERCPCLLLAIATVSSAQLAAEDTPAIAAPLAARVLAAHNVERAEFGSPQLAWEPALAAGAATHARQMALTGLFAHSDRKARPRIGENLWMGTRGAFTIESMVGAWVSEKRMFSPGIFPTVSTTKNWSDVGHYTQMVWPTTLRIGCALGTNARAEYLVCRYSPAGNIDGVAI